MPNIRLAEAADYVGISDDTLRQWIADGSLSQSKDDAGEAVVDSVELAQFVQGRDSAPKLPSGVARSARNQFVGLVTRVVTDPVMSQVELQCGPFRVVSLMSTEAVHDLDLKVGAIAVAVVKATTVIIETEA